MSSNSRLQFAAIRRRLATLLDYLGRGARARRQPVADPVALQQFLDSRSSHIAQTALYGYLRTRSGTQFPSLFEDDAFVVSINHAKWEMWVACLSDLSIYAGGQLARATTNPSAAVGTVIGRAVATILEQTKLPHDAGPGFAAAVETLRARLEHCDWHAVPDGEAVFTESPEALVRHAPIMRELMDLDEEIVRNSVRFRWHEIRRELGRLLDADALLASVD